MQGTFQIAISDSFLDSIIELPKNVQKRIKPLIEKIKSQNGNGINFEKLVGTKDQDLFSLRINQDYRCIAKREDNNLLLLHADHHDEAYDWAQNRKCCINKHTQSYQMYDVPDYKPILNDKHQKRLFDNYSDSDLIEIGVPEDMLPFTRTFLEKQDFTSNKHLFPNDAFENLSFLVEGISLAEVKEYVDSKKPNTPIKNFSDAISTPESRRSFYVLNSDEEFSKMLDAPLEKWRVFLHPTQREIVEKKYSGPACILGGPGTGKTVVAMHRAKYLAAKYVKDNVDHREPSVIYHSLGLNFKAKVLFITFNTNLADDIKGNLLELCNEHELSNIIVININAWVSDYLSKIYPGFKISYDIDRDTGIEDIWKKAAESMKIEYSTSFKKEYKYICDNLNYFTLDQYLKANDKRAFFDRLPKDFCEKTWKVIKRYWDILTDNKIVDIDYAIWVCRKHILDKNVELNKHIIVDEGQDLSANAFRLIRAIAGKEHDNDIFIVADAHQRIYKEKADLSKCGINTRDRCYKLHINYRTTDEIRKDALAVLKGLSFDDLNGGTDYKEDCISLTSGVRPQCFYFKDNIKEMEFVVKEIKKLNKSGTPFGNICVTARNNYIVNRVEAELNRKKIKASLITAYKSSNSDCVSVGTMHRIKGLEFQYVFIVEANRSIIPSSIGIEHASDNFEKQEHINAEKCLLYVAMTRAQRGVYVTASYNPTSLLEFESK